MQVALSRPECLLLWSCFKTSYISLFLPINKKYPIPEVSSVMSRDGWISIELFNEGFEEVGEVF